MGEIKNDIGLYELEQVFQHMTQSSCNKYIHLPVEIEGNENYVHFKRSAPLDESPKYPSYIEVNVK